MSAIGNVNLILLVQTIDSLIVVHLNTDAVPEVASCFVDMCLFFNDGVSNLLRGCELRDCSVPNMDH
jgi:hypothetical protein